MADEVIADDAAPETPDSPEVDAPESAPQPEGEGTRAEQQEQIDWEKRYKDTQSDFTRIAQENSQLRQAQEEQQFLAGLSDPDTQEQHVQHLVAELGEDGARAWLEEHGFEIEDDESDDAEFRDPRVDQLLSEREQERVNAQAADVEKGALAEIDKLAADKSLELDEPTKDLLFDAALARAMQTGGKLEVGPIIDQYKAALDSQIKQYRATKRDQPTPPVPGGSGTPNPSLGNSKDRLALMNQIAQEAQESA